MFQGEGLSTWSVWWLRMLHYRFITIFNIDEYLQSHHSIVELNHDIAYLGQHPKADQVGSQP